MHNMDALAPFFGGVKELARKERRFPLGKNPNERPPAACRNLSAGLLQKLFFNRLFALWKHKNRCVFLALELEQYQSSRLFLLRPITGARNHDVGENA